LDWLSADTFTTKHEELRQARIANSGEWFLEATDFKNWVNGDINCLLCQGIRKLPLKEQFLMV
jgi:hypothetical protein